MPRSIRPGQTDADPRRRHEFAAIAQLLIGATIISFSPVFVEVASVGPTTAGFYRSLFGGLSLLVVVRVRGDSLWRGVRPLGLALACGTLFAADLSFWHRSIHHVGPGLATILGNFQIFLLAAYGILVSHQRIDWRLLLSLPLAIAGLFFLVGVDWDHLREDYKLGVLFGLLTAVAYAGYTLALQNSQSRPIRLGPAANLAWISLLTALLMAGEVALVGESFRIPDTRSGISLLTYGVVCQALGWIVISRALPWTQASRAGLILLLQPTLAFVWDVVFFSRPFGAMDAIGAVLTLTAIYLGGVRSS